MTSSKYLLSFTGVYDRLMEIENEMLSLELIAAIRDKRHRFEQDGVTHLYNQMAAWVKEDEQGEEWKVSETPTKPF